MKDIMVFKPYDHKLSKNNTVFTVIVEPNNLLYLKYKIHLLVFASKWKRLSYMKRSLMSFGKTRNNWKPVLEKKTQ